LLPALRARPSLDVAIRARRESYAATLELLRTDVLAIHSRVTDDGPGT
jgi:hypothetical protein